MYKKIISFSIIAFMFFVFYVQMILDLSNRANHAWNFDVVGKKQG